jgi:arginyl-tRNA synthetase
MIPTIEIGRPKDLKHGDYAANVAMQLAKPARMAPLAIAQAIAAHLPAHPALGEAQVLAPGFLNFRLSDVWLASHR